MKRRVPAWVLVGCSSLLPCGCGGETKPEPKAPPAAVTASSAPILECPPWATPASNGRDCESTRLTQFLEESQQKLQAEPAKGTPSWFDPFVEELTRKYVAEFDTLEPMTRVRLLKALVAHPDPRSVPALRKALQEYARSPRDKNYQDLALACDAASKLRRLDSPDLGPDLLAAFLTFRFTTQTGGLAYRPLSAALLAHRDRSWTKPLMAALEVDFPNRGKPDDLQAAKAFNDAVFLQVTSAQLLGLLGNPRAVDPLLRVTLDPAKLQAAFTAIFALVRLGRPARERTQALLEGNVPELTAFAKERAARLDAVPDEHPHVSMAALILGTMGHPDGEATLVAAAKRERGKALYGVAKGLTRLGKTPKSEAAFKAAFARIDTKQVAYDRPALAELADDASYYSDPALVPWLLQRAKLTQGPAEAVKQVREALLNTAIQLMTAAQVGNVEAAVKSLGDEAQATRLALAKELALKCKDAPKCYLAELVSAQNQTAERTSVGVKAAHMLAAFGDAAARDELVQHWSSIRHPEVANAAALAIDRLTPNGSLELADELQAYIDAQGKAPGSVRLTSALQSVTYRLRARAPERTLGKDG